MGLLRISRFSYVHIICISAALLLRAYASFHLDLVNYPDSETYELIALQSYNGLTVTLPTRPLGYPLFLTWLYNAFGPMRSYAVYAQHLLGVLSYFLYYSILFHIFRKKTIAALFAFAIIISGNLLIYERAVLSDFLNHFLLLVSVFIAFKYFKSRSPYLMAPLALASAAASFTRPTSNLFTALMLFFLAVELLMNMKKRERGICHFKSITVYAALLVIFSAGFNFYGVKKTGFKGEPVGVLGVTMLIRTADFIDYSSPLHAGIKEDFRTLQKGYLADYVPEYANFLSGYMLYTGIKCDIDDATGKAYANTAMSAGRFYGFHAVGPNFFNSHDVLRELKCDAETIDRIVLAISKEAVFSNFAPFLRSTLSNFMGFVEVNPWEYLSFSASAERGGAGLLSGFLGLNQSIDRIMGNRAVSFLLLAFFVLGVFAFYCLEGDKGRRTAVTFLLCFILLNYLTLAVIADHPASRYKLPFWWMQLPLLVYFISVTISGFIKLSGDAPSLTETGPADEL
ncbi:MAG: hypothetical protein HY954_02175 [Deltaproteobacteria bacterium]|nr:hypothetical protein [Deltaproteobacteria bacterium]